MKDRPDQPSWVQDLSWALRHLYDPAELRKSPLNELLGLDPRRGPSALRQALLDAIEALKPPESVAPQAKAWRVYHALSYRYAEQFSQQEVAKTLGTGIRHLRRLERLAVRALADYVCERYGLQVGTDTRPAMSPADGPALWAAAPSREQELQWVEGTSTSEAIALEAILEPALKTVTPLSRALGVEIVCRLASDLPPLAVHSIPLRQALLSTLTAAIRAVPKGNVALEAFRRDQQVHISVEPASAAHAAVCGLEDLAEGLEMAQRLVEVSGGSLVVERDAGAGQPFAARLRLPAAEQRVVLIVDDNNDTLQLFQRYLTGTPYPCVATRDPQKALELAEGLNPQAIVLDVMLPAVDGWELLAHLREGPLTRAIPVIVCTILAEEQLALALGAAAFLRKPVGRSDFLATLDCLTHRGASVSASAPRSTPPAGARPVRPIG